VWRQHFHEFAIMRVKEERDLANFWTKGLKQTKQAALDSSYAKVRGKDKNTQLAHSIQNIKR
jgi:hypothetical protein